MFVKLLNSQIITPTSVVVLIFNLTPCNKLSTIISPEESISWFKLPATTYPNKITGFVFNQIKIKHYNCINKMLIE